MFLKHIFNEIQAFQFQQNKNKSSFEMHECQQYFRIQSEWILLGGIRATELI